MSTSVQELETRVVSVPERARTISITNNAQYEEAAEILKTIKGLRAEIDSTFNPIIAKAHEAHKEAIEQKKKVDAPLVEAETLLKPRMAAYLQEQERIRREEELRLQKQAQEEAERLQLEEAAALDSVGETAAANALLDEAPYVPPVIAPRVTPRVSGISMRHTWSAEVMDLAALLKAIVAGRAPIQCIQPNQAFLNQQARSLKNALNWPGVRAVPDSNIAASRK